MTQFNVKVNHGRKLVATVRVIATDTRHAILMAESTVRTYHGVPSQVTLMGMVVR